jgi:hypothetical protein
MATDSDAAIEELLEAVFFCVVHAKAIMRTSRTS